MVDFKRSTPTQAHQGNPPANRLQAGQQRQGVRQANSPVTNNKPTWVASQRPKWKVANGKNEGGTIPLAIHKQRLQASTNATTASKTPTPKKTLAERSAVPQPAEKIKFEALKQAASAKHVMQNRPEIASALKTAGYKPNDILCPRRILPENLIGDLKPLGAGALNQAYTGLFKTEDGKHMEVIIKFEQQYKNKSEMPEFLCGLQINPEDTRESSRNLAAKTLDNLLDWNNIVHTELGVLKDPSSGDYRVVTAMAKAEGTSGYGQALGGKTIEDPKILDQYKRIKSEIAQLDQHVQSNLAQKTKIETELKAISNNTSTIQQEDKVKDLEKKLAVTNQRIKNFQEEIGSSKTVYHVLLANLKFYSDSDLEEIYSEPKNQNQEKELIGLKGPRLGYNVEPRDPKLKEELVKLQLQDIILSQGDRHIGNYFIRTEPNGLNGKEKILGLQGIDNDQLGGSATTIEVSRNLKGLPPEIPSSVCKDLIKLKPRDFQRQMECCLPKAEAKAATARLKLVQQHCQKVLKNNQKQGEGSLLPGSKYSHDNSYYMAFLNEHFPEEYNKLDNAS